jgi:hypothetical protein
MTFPKIKESELKALLEEVATDLSKAFESEKDKLAKADGSSDLVKEDAPGEEKPGEEPADEGSSVPPGDVSPPADEGGAEAAPEASAAASPDGAPAPDAAMDPAQDAAAALTPEALQAEYQQLSPEELDMHIKAALAAKAAVAGAPDASMGPGAAPGGAPGGMPGSPPPGPAAAPPSPPMPDDPMALKSEVSAGTKKATGGAIKAGGALGKSENDKAIEALIKASEEKMAQLEALVKSQGEDNENLAKAIKMMIEQPLRKAVTSVAHLPKTETQKAPLTKAVIDARLKELSAKPDLKKSDRRLINDFYDGVVKADALAPLFEDYK